MSRFLWFRFGAMETSYGLPSPRRLSRFSRCHWLREVWWIRSSLLRRISTRVMWSG